MGGTPLSSLLFPVIIRVSSSPGPEATVLIIHMALTGIAAFILPMGTTPNAIVFISGYLEIRDMLKIG
ncbi:MAG: anion permease [Bacteroidales bacterium]|nr:anion permease [Bacteroidales bacterium]